MEIFAKYCKKKMEENGTPKDLQLDCYRVACDELKCQALALINKANSYPFQTAGLWCEWDYVAPDMDLSDGAFGWYILDEIKKDGRVEITTLDGVVHYRTEK